MNDDHWFKNASPAGLEKLQIFCSFNANILFFHPLDASILYFILIFPFIFFYIIFKCLLFFYSIVAIIAND